MERQYRVKLEVMMTVTVDGDRDRLEDVLSDMDYDFEVGEGEENAEIVTTEITDWEITNQRDDSILV